MKTIMFSSPTIPSPEYMRMCFDEGVVPDARKQLLAGNSVVILEGIPQEYIDRIQKIVWELND